MLLSAICVGAFIEKGEKFLLVEETNGKYNFPMGNLEQSEDLIAGCIREVKEETGYTIIVKSLRKVLHIKRGGVYLTKFLFNSQITRTQKEKIIDEKVVASKWVSLNEFKEMNKEGLLRSSDMIVLIEDCLTGYYEE
jgi:8-oxo-dGTP pyrophosphatase MutT (NUDIX family)